MKSQFEELYNKSFYLFFDGLHRYAFTLVKDNAKASDMVQSVFLKWWENKTQIKSESEIKAYLYTAVYRTCLNQIRNDKTKMSSSKNYFRQVDESVSGVEETMEFEELNESVQSAINDLPPQCKVIFCKSRFEEKKYTEIADEMNLSIKTIEAQMGKALKHLREKLKIYLMSPN